jgi:16S rRNA (cytidine1402-2'-O)-methyltransferase
VEKSLEDLMTVFGDINIVIAREMTKKFEETIRGKISVMLGHFKNKKPRGEFVILLNLKNQSCFAATFKD